jgi:hypothetical protein
LIDRESVPPATSPWPVILTAVITASAAFLGVVVAQWWTTRREDRNWKRQLQMYAQQWEDQRARDAEQREDQRQRDRELWAREDQHRFTEYKRDLYARQIHSIRDLRDSVQRLVGGIHQALIEGRELKNIRDIHEYLDRDLLERTRDAAVAASMTRDELALVAPRSVEKDVTDAYETLVDARTDILLTNDWEAAQERLNNFYLSILIGVMREDLTGQSSS